MEFWGVEVKPGEPLKVEPESGKLVHISQAAIGEVKDVKGAKSIPLCVKIDSKKHVIGTLSAEDRPQVMFDLVFEKDFELSHDCKSGSVYFLGYVADDPMREDGFSEDEQYLFNAPLVNGGKVARKVEPTLSDDSLLSDDSDDDEDDGKPDDLSDDTDSDEDTSDNELSEEETPKKAKESNKKRPSAAAAAVALETPVSNKKAKNVSSGKQGSKSVHNATPYPSKKGGKTPAGNRRN